MMCFFEKIYIGYYTHVHSIIKNILFSKTDDDITSCVKELYNHPNIAGALVKTTQNYSQNFNRQYARHKEFYDNSFDIECVPGESGYI